MTFLLSLFHILTQSFPPGPSFFPPFSFTVFFGGYFGRVARRPPASAVDEGVLSRLLTPTQASLARSKSAAALSAEGTDAPGKLLSGDRDREEGWLKHMSLEFFE